MYRPAQDLFKFFDIKYGQGLSDHDAINKGTVSNRSVYTQCYKCVGIVDFLDNGTEIRYDLLPGILEKLNEIKEWFATQTTFKLFASSILLIYEGYQGPGVDGSRVDVRLVDFAHTTLATEAECDPNCLFAAEQVLDHFEEIQTDSFHRSLN